MIIEVIVILKLSSIANSLITLYLIPAKMHAFNREVLVQDVFSYRFSASLQFGQVQAMRRFFSPG